MKNLQLFFSLIFPALLFGQSEPPREFSWGVFAGLETQSLDFDVRWQGENDPTVAWADRNKPGFGFGLVGIWPLTKSIALRPGLGLSFTRNLVFFRDEDLTVSSTNYRFNDVELPVHLVFTNRKGNFPLRGSFFVGGRVSWDFGSNGSPEGLVFYPHRIGPDVGLGFEVSLPKFKIQPEMVYSHCVNNVQDGTLTPEKWGIGKAVRDRISFRVLAFF